MSLRLNHVLFLLVMLAGSQGVNGQSAGLVSGTYVFREFDMATSPLSNAYEPTCAMSGTIVFNAASGAYTMTGTNTVSMLTTIQTVPFSTSGTWSYGNGRINIGGTIEGVVSQGVIIASAPDPGFSGSVYDPKITIFIAIPLGPLSSNESFGSVYQTAVLDFPGGEFKNAFFNLNPDGKGGLGTITLNGQETRSPLYPSDAINVAQSVSGGSYTVNADGSATLTVPAPAGTITGDPLFTGTKTMFASPDGNFILGWTPGGVDIFFGVKALAAGTGKNSITQGTYFTAGMDVAGMLHKRPLPSPDFYFGAYSMTGNVNGDALVQQVTSFSMTAFSTDDQIVVNPDGIAGPDALGYRYAFGAEGNGFVGIGTQGMFGLVVGVREAAPAAAGVYINPATVVNAASYQPAIAGVAPGELITLFGSGLASTTMAVAGGEPVPMNLGGVSATISGTPCPVFAVSPSQVSILVPYAVSGSEIQVTSNGVASNVAATGLFGEYGSQVGVFSQSQNGIGFAAVLHAATGELVDQANPAQPGEYISIYMTGLGTVTPAIADGAVGPNNPLSTVDFWTNGSLSVFFNDYGPGVPMESDAKGTIQFAGLAPGLAGLYQVNVQVPATGLALGDLVEIDFLIIDPRFPPTDIKQVYIPYGPGTAVPL